MTHSLTPVTAAGAYKTPAKCPCMYELASVVSVSRKSDAMPTIIEIMTNPNPLARSRVGNEMAERW